MILTVIGLTLLGVLLLLPNAVALRTAIAGAEERKAARLALRSAAVRAGGSGAAASAGEGATARPHRAIRLPRLFYRGYLWKALSPLVFALTVMFGIAVGGSTGYLLMGFGLVNLLFGLVGWQEYVPGQAGKR